jgi:hypothetical protein
MMAGTNPTLACQEHVVSQVPNGKAALGIIAATFSLLARITGPEVARNE